MKPDPRLLLFGSLKGGVGKTTSSLLAVESLVRLNDELDLKRGVVLVDADIVGTEASDVVGNEFHQSELSLVDIIQRVPTNQSVSAWLHKRIAELIENEPSSRFLIPSFGRETEAERGKWRTVLEQSGLYVQRRMLDLVSACRAHDLDVVIDLPAFDVGFATQVREGLKDEQPLISFVTDTDVRSLQATLTHMQKLATSGETPETRVVINRAPLATKQRAELERFIKGKLGKRDFVFVPELADITKATRAKEAGGSGGTADPEKRSPRGITSSLHKKINVLLAKVDHYRFLQLPSPERPRKHKKRVGA